MSAGTHNLIIEQGATFLRTISPKDSSGQPINLSGFSAIAKIRPTLESNKVLAVLTVTGTFNTDGVFSIGLTADQTLALKPGSGIWDCYLVQGEYYFRLLRGDVTVLPSISRRA